MEIETKYNRGDEVWVTVFIDQVHGSVCCMYFVKGPIPIEKIQIEVLKSGDGEVVEIGYVLKKEYNWQPVYKEENIYLTSEEAIAAMNKMNKE